MRDRDLSGFLIPVVALLALYFPFLGSASSGRRQTTPGGTSITASTDEKAGSISAQRAQPDAAGTLIRAFQGEDARAAACIIATVPDPIDAGNLAYTFDRYVDSMQRAMGSLDYVLDRFDLPWLDPTAPETAREVTEGFENLKTPGPRFRAQPGAMLFRHGPAFALLWLVGETPTSGVHKRALSAAIDQWRNHCPESELVISILGPSFSGSAHSLKRALENYGSPSDAKPVRPLQFRIISGSATSVKHSDIEIAGSITFRSTVPSDAAALTAFLAELNRLEGHIPKIALLSETTTYGYSAGNDAAGRLLRLPFPLHISSLRHVASAGVVRDQGGQNLGHATHRLTALDLTTPTHSGHVIPLLSKVETSSVEVVLSTVLETIAREQIRYVGIFASDLQDRIFLVRELRHHAPNTVIFTLGADLLYLHPDINVDFRGTLLVSPYPLFSQNQVWTYPWSGKDRRLTFPAQTAQGVYNALLALLYAPNLMLEYGRPLPDQRGAALWLSAVGADGVWPVRLLGMLHADPSVLDPDTLEDRQSRTLIEDSNVEVSVTKGSAPARHREAAAAIEPESHPWAVTVVALLSLIPALAVIGQFSAFGRWLTPERWGGTPRLSVMFGDEVFKRHRFERRLYLLACLVTLTALFVLTAATAGLGGVIGDALRGRAVGGYGVAQRDCGYAWPSS